MSDEVDPADYGLDLVPPAEREIEVTRVISVRELVPRCAAYTAAGRQCLSSGTVTTVRRGAAARISVPLCGQHRAMIGLP